MPARVRIFCTAWIVAIVAALGTMAGRAKAGDLPCFRVEAVQQAAVELAQQGAETTMLSGQDAQAYLDALNREPPQTHLTADGLIVVAMPGHGVSIWLVDGNRACLGGKIATGVNARLMAAVHEKGA